MSEFFLSVTSRSRDISALPKVLLDYAIGIFVLECQHAATRVLDEDNLLSPEELLRNDDAPQRIVGGRSCLCDFSRRPQTTMREQLPPFQHRRGKRMFTRSLTFRMT